MFRDPTDESHFKLKMALTYDWEVRVEALTLTLVHNIGVCVSMNKNHELPTYCFLVL